jgi:hypothetical protein
MSINKKVMVTKTCDLCGKQEGVHLKKKDFFTEPPSLVMKNYKGEDVLLTLNVNIEKFDKSEEDIVLEDILETYRESHQELQESIADTSPIPFKYHNALPRDVLQVIQYYYMKAMREEENQGILCKHCHKEMVKLISKLGKFDKIEIF